MTGRDRIVLIVVAVLALIGAGWMLVVSPKRQEASKLGTQLSEAKTQLAGAEGEVSQARAAQAKYSAAYASLVSLGKAVPTSQEVPSLIYQLSRASNQKNVDFASIAATSSGTAPSSPSGGGSTAAAPSGSGASGAATAGFSQMPFTFVFNGSFFDLEHLFQQLNRFTIRGASGNLQVSGRLLTIQSVKLVPAASGPAGALSDVLTGTVTATAYVLPAGQAATGGATPSSPTGNSTTPVSSATGASSSPTAPAVARVTP